MENKLQVFENEEFGKVRVVEIDGVPWFVGKDVADALGYGQARKAISAHVDAEDGMKHTILSNGGTQQTWIINESGLYSLILSSKLPTAKKFKRWVTSEILPSIHKYGAYITEETLAKMRQSSEFTSELLDRLMAEKEKNVALKEYADELAPKARYYDLILQNVDAMPVSLIAKDYGMSAAAFNKLLHGLKIQYQIGRTWILYQKHAGHGYTLTRTFHVNEHTVKIQTYWTQKGRVFLYEFLRQLDIFPVIESRATKY